jgi:predicted Fe-Mo cluster-binding NifX family protein
MPVDGEAVGSHWGRAPRVAVVAVDGGGIIGWEEFDVGWDVSHDQPNHGAHHANIARFVQEHQVTAVVAAGMGPPMVNMLNKLGIDVWLGAVGPARELAAAVIEEATKQGEGESQ